MLLRIISTVIEKRYILDFITTQSQFQPLVFLEFVYLEFDYLIRICVSEIWLHN